jgi:hypothetical protein
MIRSGDIVVGHGRQMKVGITYSDWCRCVWFDLHGHLRSRWFYLNELVPLRDAIRPRSCWPAAGDLELREAEKEEREAAVARKAAQRAARKARRKGLRVAA